MEGHIGDVQRLALVLDRTISRTLTARSRELQLHRKTLTQPEDLRFILEQEAERRLHGDFVQLFRWLSGTIAPLTASAIRELGNTKKLLEDGQGVAKQHGVADSDLDDVVSFTIALLPRYPELREMATGTKGRPTALKRAVLTIPLPQETTS